MEDIITDDRRQLSAKGLNREQQETKQHKRCRNMRQYLADLLIYTLIAALFCLINFTLFAQAGSYHLFDAAANLPAEALFIISAVVIICLGICALFSFAKWMQQLFAAIVFGLSIFAVFNQFALFDKASFLADGIGRLFNTQIASYFATSSHLIISVAGALLFWLFLSRSRRSTLAYFTGILLLSWGGLLSEAYFSPLKSGFRTTYEPFQSGEQSPVKADRKRFIHIAVPNLGSVTTLRNLQPAKQPDQKIEAAIHNMLGFYAQNNFNYYPHAYVTEQDPFLNLTTSYNPIKFSQPATEYTLNNVMLPGYWDFHQLSTPQLYLKSNKLFDSFRKNNYAIKVYQSRGLENCYINNRWDVDKCVNKQNLPINLDGTNLTTTQKTVLFMAQWLESTGLVNNISALNPVLGFFGSAKTAPVINFPTEKLYVADSFKVFDFLNRDIASETTDTAYFVTIDLPGDLFIYDDHCHLKPMPQWIAAGSTDKMAQRQAYAEQTSCLVGQLEKFVQQLKAQGQLASSVIVINGLSAPNIGNSQSVDTFDTFAQKLVTMAIFDPLQKNYTIGTKVCLAPALLKSYLYKKPCTEYEQMPLLPNQQKELMTKLADDNYSTEEIGSAVTAFVSWYDAWAKANNVPNSAATMPAEAQSDATLEIKAVETAAPVEELKPEAATESLSEAAAKMPTAATAEPETAAEPVIVEEEVLKLDNGVEVKVKVIDRNAEAETDDVVDTDVIPPFVQDLPRAPETAK